MARQPTVGGDDGSWGSVLNTYLSVALSSDGTLKNLFINVKDYGALGDGSNNDTSAIQAAINACSAASGGTVFFPQGYYRINSGLTVPTGVMLLGVGNGGSGIATEIRYYGTTGYAITFNASALFMGITNMRISAWADQSSGGMIKADTSSSFIIMQNVVASSSVTSYGYIGYDITAAVGVSMVSCYAFGMEQYSVYIHGAGNEFFCIGGQFDGQQTSTGTSLYIDSWSGGTAYFQGCSFLQNAKACKILGSSSRWIYFTNVSWDGAKDGIDLTAGEFMFFTGCYTATTATGGSAGYGMELNGANRVFISNSNIHSSKKSGVALITGGEIYISNSLINNNNVSGTAVQGGINVGTAFGDFTVTNCRIGNIGNSSWTGDQKWGIIVNSGWSGTAVISGNDVNDNTTAGMILNGTMTGAKVSHNLGYNPVGSVSAPSIPATTVAQSNTFGIDMTVYVTGGTVTAIAVGGTATGLTSGAFRVPAGSTITLSYSSAPTWTWFAD